MMSGAGRAQVLRDLLRQADACRILLHPDEVEVVRDAIALYDPSEEEEDD